MPKNSEIRLIQSVAKDAGIRLSSRMAVKASAAMDRMGDDALTIPEIEAYLHLWSDPTGETAAKNVDAERSAVAA